MGFEDVFKDPPFEPEYERVLEQEHIKCLVMGAICMVKYIL